jgi:uncharacterized spore protein YtfJ
VSKPPKSKRKLARVEVPRVEVPGPDAVGPLRPRSLAGEVRRVVDRASGARLCYGEPVVAGDRTVVPVSRVAVAGGYGFGRGGGSAEESSEGTGHGGGGWLEARPVGFVEIGPDGARYQAIPDPDQLGRTLKAAAAALVTVSGALALGRGRRRPRPPRGLLGR